MPRTESRTNSVIRLHVTHVLVRLYLLHVPRIWLTCKVTVWGAQSGKSSKTRDSDSGARKPAILRVARTQTSSFRDPCKQASTI